MSTLLHEDHRCAPPGDTSSSSRSYLELQRTDFSGVTVSLPTSQKSFFPCPVASPFHLDAVAVADDDSTEKHQISSSEMSNASLLCQQSRQPTPGFCSLPLFEAKCH